MAKVVINFQKSKWSLLYVAFFVIFSSLPSFAQQSQTKIEGKVLDAKTGETIVGASVQIKSDKTGTDTDINGAFTLAVKSFPATLTVSYIGYRTEEVDIYEYADPLEINLTESGNILNEVVVIGYTTQQRKSISGAITTVSFGEVNTNQADQDLAKLLQGKAAGVQITSTSGMPGGGVSLIIRGNNSIGGSVSPLYVVDGVFYNAGIPVTGGGGNLLSSPLADINPADIESISLLKDANATAIYGSQGSNGVVVITTKRGAKNTASRINLSITQGWANAAKQWKAVSGPETGQLLYESWANTAQENGQTLEYYLNSQKPTNWDIVFPHKNPDGTPDFSRNNIADLPTYDRISDLFQTANVSDYQLSISGGDAKSNHYVAVGYAGQENIIKPNSFRRFSGRINYDNNITSKLKVGTSFSLARTERAKVRNSDNDPGGIINNAIFPRSFLPVFDENGNYLSHATFNNHLKVIKHLDNNYVTWRNTVNLYGEYAFLPELKYRSSWSFDYTNNLSRSFSDFALSNTGSASANSNLSLIYTAEQLLTYVKSFSKKHDVNFLLGNTVNVSQSQNVGSSGSDYIFDVLKEVSSAANTSGSSSRSESRLVSFFGKGGYTYDNKYTFEFSLRADGSSRFGKNVRWGYFPAGGISWNAGQEDFIRNLRIFDALKFRASFGYSGNQNGIGNYDALGIWSASSQSYLDQPSLSPGRLANPELTWETTQQADIGLEFAILKDRLNVDIDVYRKYTTNGIQSVAVPSRSGYASATRNYSEISNKGIEFTLQSINYKTKAFKWTTEFNISANRNKIEKIPQEQTMGATNRGTSILREGYPVNSFFLYKQLYVDPQTGNAVYDDVNKDGYITYDDRQIVGSANPNFTGGLTNTATWKDWEFNIFFYFTQGNELLNMQDLFLVHGGTQNGIGFFPQQLKRWQKPGDITDIPKMTKYNLNPTANNSAANNYTGQVANLSSRYLDDGSFLRLKNLSISYNLPKSAVSWLHLNRVKTTFSASNLWILTNYKGLDPEVSAQSENQNTAGYDWATVPQPRTFEIKLNVTF
ncbi:MAG: SusC/RagA family TonB-linked outer membrane protein [Tannerella sp.]|nr:SusC/RagA family TonB-linked outer membrane protein [Tannerella sp.]